MKPCPIDISKPAAGLLPSIIRDGDSARKVKNLGWILRNWQLVESWDVYPHPFIAEGYSAELYIVARLRDGRTYESGYSSASVFRGWIDRPIFRGLPVNWHPTLATV